MIQEHRLYFIVYSLTLVCLCLLFHEQRAAAILLLVNVAIAFHPELLSWARRTWSGLRRK